MNASLRVSKSRCDVAEVLFHVAFFFSFYFLVCIVLLQVSHMDRAAAGYHQSIFQSRQVYYPFSPYRFSNSNTNSSMSNVIAIRRTSTSAPVISITIGTLPVTVPSSAMLARTNKFIFLFYFLFLLFRSNSGPCPKRNRT